MHGLGPTRTRVLSLLQSTSDPVTVGAVADELELHKNSARFHLDALVEAGYAERSTEPSGRTGRPPLLYAATSEAPTISNAHLLELTKVLLDEFVASEDDGAARARRAGQRWGSRTRATAEPTVDVIKAEMAMRGFGVQDDGATLTFTRCPFRDEISDDQLPLVCAMHQGLLDGMTVGSPITISNLQVGPRVCHAAISIAS
ncbi:MAG: helix-turn-helix domain-containing protein [Propionibacteriaceae bacterium]|nr:helix-turn-helix domain-containing protein [Propionibacteriaceae bacterium]